MKCTFCGYELPDGAKFCPNCGTPAEAPLNDGYSQEEVEGETPVSAEIPGSAEMSEPVEAPAEGQEYSYGNTQESNEETPEYSYGSEQEEDNGAVYSYGVPEMKGNPSQNQDSYQYRNQNPYSQNSYNQPNYNNFDPNQKRINGTLYLVFSILATVLCCLPLGIAAIVYAVKINNLQNAGDYEGAKKAAKTSRILMIISALVTIIATIAMIALGATALVEDDDFREEIINELDEDNDDSSVVFNDDDEDGDISSDAGGASSGLSDVWASGQVQIGETILTFPCTMEEIQEKGFSVYSDDTTKEVEAHDFEFMTFHNEDGNDLSFVIYNNEDENLPVEKCMVGGCEFSEGIDFTAYAPGDVCVGMDYEDVLEIYGEPSYSNEEGNYYIYYEWCGDDYYTYVDVYVDINTNTVADIAVFHFGDFELQ